MTVDAGVQAPRRARQSRDRRPLRGHDRHRHRRHAERARLVQRHAAADDGNESHRPSSRARSREGPIRLQVALGGCDLRPCGPGPTKRTRRRPAPGRRGAGGRSPRQSPATRARGPPPSARSTSRRRPGESRRRFNAGSRMANCGRRAACALLEPAAPARSRCRRCADRRRRGSRDRGRGCSRRRRRRRRAARSSGAPRRPPDRRR